jgi:hypothetical protein
MEIHKVQAENNKMGTKRAMQKKSMEQKLSLWKEQNWQSPSQTNQKEEGEDPSWQN